MEASGGLPDHHPQAGLLDPGYDRFRMDRFPQGIDREDLCSQLSTDSGVGDTGSGECSFSASPVAGLSDAERSPHAPILSMPPSLLSHRGPPASLSLQIKEEPLENFASFASPRSRCDSLSSIMSSPGPTPSEISHQPPSSPTSSVCSGLSSISGRGHYSSTVIKELIQQVCFHTEH